jgi:hypothetical protein
MSAAEDVERKVAVAAVIAVEEAIFLLAVIRSCGIRSRISAGAPVVSAKRSTKARRRLRQFDATVATLSPSETLPL